MGVPNKSGQNHNGGRGDRAAKQSPASKGCTRKSEVQQPTPQHLRPANWSASRHVMRCRGR
eukprot:67685-Chlamydomonas_euryale.AAC.1